MDQKRKKILVVDDNLKIQEILSKFFKEEGYDFVSSYTGRDSFRLIREEKPDLIIMDMVLPGEDGLEILEEFRRDSEIEKIPKVVLSNLDDKEQVEQAKEKGVVKYLSKPHYKLKEILKEIEEVIGEKEQNKLPVEGKKLIVMLNDDNFLLSVFKNIFEEKGFEFKGFDSIPPSNVSKIIEGLDPLAIIVDLVMCFDGIKVIGDLKADENFKETPIIVLDNIYNEEEIEETKKAGAIAYISMKENNPTQAAGKILDLLVQRHSS